jgi:hypothetical protein
MDFVLLLLRILQLAWQTGTESIVSAQRPLVACVSGAKAHAIRVHYDNPYHRVSLVQGDLRNANDRITTSALGTYTYNDRLHRWRMCYGCFWMARGDAADASIVRYPDSDFPFFAPGQDAKSLVKKKYGNSNTYGGAAYGWTPEPAVGYARDLVLKARRGKIEWPKKYPAFDVLPTGTVSGRLFLLLTSKLAVWNGILIWDMENSCWKTKWSEQEEIAVDFDEQFITFAQGGRYFFITESLKVYVVRDTKQRTRKAEILWHDTRQPIQALITDVDTNTTFVFGRSATNVTGGGKDYYFPLSENLVVTYFDRSLLPRPQPDEPIRHVMSYARFLVAQKRIVLK